MSDIGGFWECWHTQSKEYSIFLRIARQDFFWETEEER